MGVARKMGARYMECSSKEMIGVHEIFEEAINTVVANDASNQPRQTPSQGQSGGGGGGMRKKKRSCRML
jgi:Ras family protein A